MIKPPLPAAGPAAKFASTLVSRMPTAIGDIDNLPQALTIGGVDYAPTAYLVADDINPSTGAWASRHDVTKILSVTGSGAVPTYGVDSAISNDAVKYNAARYHQAANTTWGTFGANDGAIEIIAAFGSTLGYVVTTNNAASGNEKGFTIYVNGNTLRAYLDNGAGTAVSIVDSSARFGIGHYLICYDRSEKVYLFTNGVYSASADISGITGDITESPLTVGAAPNGTTPTVAQLNHAAIWNLGGNIWPGAETNQAVMGAIAASRFATIAGIGCTKGTTYSFARASTAYLDRYISATQRQLFPVSSGWPRVCERKDNDGETVTGYLSEVQATNDFTYSEDATQWSTVRTTVSSNATTAPDGTTTADGIISDAGNNTHYVSISCAGMDSPHVFSCFLKAAAQNWARMDIHTQANAYVYFDISALAGTVGTIGADITSYGIEPWGNGWYRCWIEYTGGVPSHEHHVHTCNADDGQTWDSPGSVVDLYVWGAQHEDEGIVVPSSYVKTAAATATRIKDALTRTIPAIDTGKIAVECTALLGTGHNSTQIKTIVAVDDLG